MGGEGVAEAGGGPGLPATLCQTNMIESLMGNDEELIMMGRKGKAYRRACIPRGGRRAGIVQVHKGDGRKI